MPKFTKKSLLSVLSALALAIGTASADECRDLSHAKRAHVFVISDSAGPVYGYAELADVNTAWKSTQTNWTKTIKGESIADVRAKLAKMMRDDVIPNPRPPKIIDDGLFGPRVEWGSIDDDRKTIYNVSKWAPPVPDGYWKRHYKRTFELPSTRD